MRHRDGNLRDLGSWDVVGGVRGSIFMQKFVLFFSSYFSAKDKCMNCLPAKLVVKSLQFSVNIEMHF